MGLGKICGVERSSTGVLIHASELKSHMEKRIKLVLGSVDSHSHTFQEFFGSQQSQKKIIHTVFFVSCPMIIPRVLPFWASLSMRSVSACQPDP